MAKRSASRNKRKELRRQRQAKQKKQQLQLYAIGAILIIAILAALGWWWQGYLTRQEIGEFVPSLGRDHIDVGDSHVPYNSDPPTSGPHAAAANRGFYESSIPDENVVHNLEHGYVAISYDCDKLEDCELAKTNIRNLLNRYNNEQLIAVPRQNRDAAIALTAWQRIDLLEEYDEDRMTTFIEAWRGRAPENVP